LVRGLRFDYRRIRAMLRKPDFVVAHRAAFGRASAPAMEQKLLIPFRAQYRAIHQARLKSEVPHGALDTVTGGAVQLRIANDAALAYLASAHLELRFDQDRHLAAAA
jgi:hypothetical protein